MIVPLEIPLQAAVTPLQAVEVLPQAVVIPEPILEQIPELRDITIDQAVIGSCTNGRIEDMRAAAEVLRGRVVADNVRCIVIPATQGVWLQCVHEGLMDVFINAHCVVSTPTCGPCLGGYMGILAAGERCVSSTNRNFVGRMGDPTSEVYLASPAVCAASAVAGHIALPSDLD